MTPLLIIHGGAGRALKDPARGPIVQSALRAACELVYALLRDGLSAMEAVRLGCELLEDDVNFNAGTGSVLQSDGQIRMTASIMDGERQAFSGVVNVEQVQHPIAMAHVLNTEPDRVIAGAGASLLARELGLDIYDPRTHKRLREWVEERERGFTSDPAQVVATEHRTGTIGVVAMDTTGRIAAGTSTGGRGFERVGRVSDSGTPAGNYATEYVGISCTGIGEDILDEGLAVRVAVRLEDGMTLVQAMEKSMQDSVKRGRMLGAIAISRDGEVVWGKTTDLLLAAWDSGHGVHDCVDAVPGPITQQVGG